MNTYYLRAHWVFLKVTIVFSLFSMSWPVLGQVKPAEIKPAKPSNTVATVATSLTTITTGITTGSESAEPVEQSSVVQVSRELPAAEPEHPMAPTIRYARRALSKIEQGIEDYSCTLVKRERIAGRLRPYETIALKVRHEPFSIYMRFLGPKKLRDRECLYVAGQNDNLVTAHEGQGLMARLPSVKLDPLGSLAMSGQRYPITEVGIRRLAERLLATAIHDSKYDEAEVQLFPKVKLKGRETLCIQVTHPEPRSHFRYHVGRVFVDNQLQIPIRYVGYLWPKELGGKPLIDEEYTYLDLKVNNGFTDLDFDRQNPEYNF